MPRSPRPRAWLAALLAFAILALLAPVAHADLRAGSTRAIATKSGQLKEPLPRLLATPKVVARIADGRLALKVRARYRVSNWHGSKRVRRDRALLFLTVASKMTRTGPSPVGRVFSHVWVDHRLRHRHANRTYTLVLSDQASRFLRSRGVFSGNRERRRRALRLITVRVEQDRDFKRVNGRFDWREGTAYSPADTILPPAKPSQAQASGSEHPEGTLSVTNATAAGVYCSSGCPQWNNSAGQPGSLAGTADSSPYAEQLAVGGAASVCFEQGSRGSNPEGFANFGANGQPQPYQPGSVIGAGEVGDSEFPVLDGTTVTEGIVAYDGLHAPNEEETATAAAATTESLNIGLTAIKIGAGVPASTLGFAIGFPSPGAIVSGILGLTEFLINRSCDAAPNLVNVSAAEAGGGAFSAEIQAQTQFFDYYRPESGSAAGVQLNPSTLSYNGSSLYLMPHTVEATGLGDNVCDCQKYTGNNAIYLEWSNYEPCGSYFGSGLSCSVSAPTDTATASSDNVNCGPGNTACDFPASQGVSTPSTSPSGVGEVTTCSTNFREGTTLHAGEAATSPSGTYTLAMLTNGALSWFDGPANSMWASTSNENAPAYSDGPSSIRAGSYATMQGDGNFVVYTPQGTPIFATSTVGNPGAYLALQNDGNLVVYSAAGQPLWASNTYRGPACTG